MASATIADLPKNAEMLKEQAETLMQGSKGNDRFKPFKWTARLCKGEFGMYYREGGICHMGLAMQLQLTA